MFANRSKPVRLTNLAKKHYYLSRCYDVMWHEQLSIADRFFWKKLSLTLTIQTNIFLAFSNTKGYIFYKTDAGDTLTRNWRS